MGLWNAKCTGSIWGLTNKTWSKRQSWLKPSLPWGWKKSPKARGLKAQWLLVTSVCQGTESTQPMFCYCYNMTSASVPLKMYSSSDFWWEGFRFEGFQASFACPRDISGFIRLPSGCHHCACQQSHQESVWYLKLELSIKGDTAKKTRNSTFTDTSVPLYQLQGQTRHNWGNGAMKKGRP